MGRTRVLVERVLPIGLLVLSAVSVPALALSPWGLPRLDALQRERAAVSEEISRLSDEIRQLRVEVERIKTDPAAVERVARDQLGLLRQTEIVFQFED